MSRPSFLVVLSLCWACGQSDGPGAVVVEHSPSGGDPSPATEDASSPATNPEGDDGVTDPEDGSDSGMGGQADGGGDPPDGPGLDAGLSGPDGMDAAVDEDGADGTGQEDAGTSDPERDCTQPLSDAWTCEPGAANFDDGCEDNDQASRAVAVAAGETIHGVLCSNPTEGTPEEHDFFVVDMRPGCTVSAELIYEKWAGDLNLVATLPSGEPAVITSDNGSRRLELQPFASGRLLLRVSAFGLASNAYELRVQQQCPSCEEDDLFEDNDSLANAAPAGKASAVSGQGLGLGAVACDEDHFFFDNERGSVGHVVLEFDPAQGPLSMELHSPSGEVTQGGVSGPGRVEVEAPLLELGRYVVRVTGDSGSPYGLTVRSDRNGCVADDYSPNGRRDASAPLLEGDATGRAVACHNQHDYFRVWSEEGCVLAPVVSGNSRIVAALRDVVGNAVGFTTNKRVQNGRALYHETERTGYYFLDVWHNSSEPIAYEFELRQMCPHQLQPSAVGQSHSGRLREQGYAFHPVELTQGCTLSAQLSQLEAEHRVDAYLLNPQQRLVSSSAPVGDGSNLRHGPVAESGRYLLRLHLSEGVETGYSLALEQQCPTEESPAPTDVLFAETFDGQSRSDLVGDGWAFGSSEVGPVAAAGPDATDALEIDHQGAASRLFAGARPRSLTVWVRGSGTLTLAGGVHDSPLFKLRFGRGGFLFIRDSFLALTTETERDTWVELRLERIDWEQQRLDLVLDGEPIVQGLGFLNSAKGLGLLTLDGPKGLGGSVLVDDLTLMQ